MTIAGRSGLVRHVIRIFGTSAPGDPDGPGGVFVAWCGARHNNLRAQVEFLPVFTHPDVLRVAMDVLQQAGVAVDPAVLQLLLPSDPIEYNDSVTADKLRLRQHRRAEDKRLFGPALPDAQVLRGRIVKGRLSAARAVKAVFATAVTVRARGVVRPWESPAFDALFWDRRWGDFVDALLPDAEDEFKIEVVRIMAEQDKEGVLDQLSARILSGRRAQETESGTATPILCDACRLAFATALLEERA